MPTLKMPNVRRMFTPDPEWTLWEADLRGADARVVAWEAADAGLKEAFHSGLDIHAHNAETIWRNRAPLAHYSMRDANGHPMFPDLARLRQRAKTACHAVNYGCKARTLADHISVPVPEAESFIRQWFRLHPGIEAWHARIEAAVRRQAAIRNVWGYRRQYFDRPDDLLPEALAWIGQSTTAIAINRLIVALARQLPEAQLLLQTHDSVTFQLPAGMEPPASVFSVTCPYADPLVMPCDVAWGESWGELRSWSPRDATPLR